MKEFIYTKKLRREDPLMTPVSHRSVNPLLKEVDLNQQSAKFGTVF